MADSGRLNTSQDDSEMSQWACAITKQLAASGRDKFCSDLNFGLWMLEKTGSLSSETAALQSMPGVP